MTPRIPTPRLSLLALAAALFSPTGVFTASAADLDGRLPKAAARQIAFADVKPILERSCAQCHSGEKPKGRFSVENREAMLNGGESKEAAIVPGHSGRSPLVHFIADVVQEMEMPPIARRAKFPPLTEAEVSIVRAWIDQGARWPDGVKLTIGPAIADKNEPAADDAAGPRHNAIFDMIRAGDRRGVLRALKDPGALHLRDAEGNTPLIQTAFYMDASQVGELIKRGAEVNATNQSGVSALMKAVWDLDKTRLLIRAGANVNASSKNGNTPLIIASFAHGSSPVVKALLTAGAKVEAANDLGNNAVVAAAEAGDVKTLRILLDHGGDPDSKSHIIESNAEATALMIAAQMGHIDCVKLLLDRGATLNLRTDHGNALNFAAFSNRHEVARLLLDRGIDVDVPGRRIVSFRKDKGLTPLIYACLSERNDPTLVKWLIEKAADINAKASSGETALSVARQRGNTKIVSTLLAAGAKMDEERAPEKKATRWNAGQVDQADPGVLREAAEAGVSMLVKSSARMTEATGNRCASCHQQSIPAVAWSNARRKGFAYPEEVARKQAASSLKASGFASRALEMPLPVPNIASWYLIGLNATGHQPDALTDKFAYTLARYQYGDGRWVTKASRAPTDYSDVTSTASAIRALKLYAPPTMKARIDRSLGKATRWLRGYHPQSTEERAMQILGLRWAGLGKSQTEKFARALLAEQSADGGWAQLTTMESDAYATGLALYALKQAEAISGSHAAYRSGVKFLLKNQLEDGSWRVSTRVSPVQVAIDDIFPHDKDQWISTVATGWAAMALMDAVETRESPKLTSLAR
jgi:ankyrin repeat protein